MGADYTFQIAVSSTIVRDPRKDVGFVVAELQKRSEVAQEVLGADGCSKNSNWRYSDYEDICRAMEELTAEPENSDMILEMECDPQGTGPDHFCTVVHRGLSKVFYSETEFPGLLEYYEELRRE